MNPISVLGSQQPTGTPAGGTAPAGGPTLLGLAGSLVSGGAVPSAFATLASIVQQSSARAGLTTLGGPASPAGTATLASGNAASTPLAVAKFVQDARASGTKVHHAHHSGGKGGGAVESGAPSTAAFLNWLSAANTSTTTDQSGEPTLLNVLA